MSKDELIHELIEFRTNKETAKKNLPKHLVEELQKINADVSPNEVASMLILGYTKPPKCYCGKELKFKPPTSIRRDTHKTIFGGWNGFCSIQCSNSSLDVKLKKIETTIKNYGVKNPFQSREIMDKIEQTNLDKYGVSHPMQNEEIKNKQQDSLEANFGVRVPLKSEIIKTTQKNTMIELYGVAFAQQNDEIRNKTLDTFIRKYGSNTPSKSDIVKQKIIETRFQRLYEYMLPEFLDIYKSNDKEAFINYIDRNGLKSRYDIAEYSKCCVSLINKFFVILGMSDMYTNDKDSREEYEILEFVHSIYQGNVIQSNRSILEGKELDIYIPDKNLAIEHDSLYYHSEFSGEKSKTYHLRKTIMCEKLGIQLLHIFDVEWNCPIKREIWKSIIKHKMGMTGTKIYARKTIVKSISSSEASKFFEANHLSGHTKASSYYGLYYNDVLVSAMSCGYRKIAQNGVAENEVIRFATKINTQVIGGLSKLLKVARRDYVNLITYADRRYSSILSVGYLSQFNTVQTSLPNFYGYKNNTKVLMSRYNFTVDKFRKMVPNYNNDLSVADNMRLNGYDRIYDCGNYKFT